MKIATCIFTIGVVLCVAAVSCLAETTPNAISQQVLRKVLFDSENATATDVWKPVGNAAASIERNPAYVKEGKSSLKLMFKLDPNQWDYGLHMTNSSVTASFSPAAVYFRVFPENTNSIMLEIGDTDGTTARWELCTLRTNTWNFVRVLLTDAAIGKSSPQADSKISSISTVTIGLQGLAATIATADPALPFSYYIDGFWATNSNLIVDNSHEAVSDKTAHNLVLAPSFWQGAEITGSLSVQSAKGKEKAVFSICKNGQSVYNSIEDIEFAEENNTIRFYLNSSRAHTKTPIWEKAYEDACAFCLPEGEYQFAIRLGKNEFKQPFSVLGRGAVEERRKQLTSKMAMLAELIASKKKKGHEIAYAQLALALAKRYAEKESAAALALKDYFRAGTDLEKCLAFIDQAITKSRSNKELQVPTFDMRHVRLDGPNFYVGKDPVTLAGPLGFRALWEWIAEVPQFGFTIIEDSSAGQVSDFSRMMAPGTWGNPDTFFHAEKASPVLTAWDRLAAENLNLAVAFNPNVQSEVPGWLYFVHPETKPDGTWGGGFAYFPIESRAVRPVLEKYYAGIVPVVKDHPNLLFYWLHCESAYWSRSPSYLKLFRDQAAGRYGSIDKVNTAWGTAYEDFAKIDVPEARNRAATYDWQVFNHDQLTEFFRFQNDQVKKYDPCAITSNKPIAYEMVLNNAVDCEAQATIYDMPGCDSYTDYYYLNPANVLLNRGIMLYDLFKSIAPNKPIANTEMHFTDESWRLEAHADQDEISQFAQSILWQSYLHGLRVCTYWGWHWTPFSQPSLTYGIGKASLDLRRSARYVAAFPPHPEVAIYYSKPSLYMDRGAYVNALTRTYVGLFFLDAPVGFITDTMLVKGIDPRIKLLVAPASYITDDAYAAIEAWVLRGGKLVVIGAGGLRHNEKDRPRDMTKLKASHNAVFWQNESSQSYAHQFDTLMSSCKINRPVRVTDDCGSPIWQIESRSVVDDGVNLTYIINLNRKQKTLCLKNADGKPIRRARDVIAEETITCPFTLKPLDVKLLVIK